MEFVILMLVEMAGDQADRRAAEPDPRPAAFVSDPPVGSLGAPGEPAAVADAPDEAEQGLVAVERAAPAGEMRRTCISRRAPLRLICTPR